MNNKPQLDFDPYQPESIPLFEALYGKNLISLGGLESVDNLFSDIDLRGLKALDIGFGLGGIAYYLAEKYTMQVSGIEIHAWMVEHANQHAPKHLMPQLNFTTYTANGQMPFHSQHFDLVYSKGVLNHVSDKATLFRQVHSALKPKGQFVIADWVFPEGMKESIAPLVCETKTSYEHFLTQAGFSKIKFRDDSPLFIEYAKKLLTNLKANDSLIIERYGNELYQIIQKQHMDLILQLENHQKIAVRIVAGK